MTGSEASRRLPTSALFNLAALAVLAGALVVHLWPEWTHDPDLSHGLLMPVACALLVYRGLHAGARGFLGEPRAAALAAVLGAAGLAGLWVAGLLAVTLDWSSPVVDFALAGSFALLGSAALAAFSGARTALLPFTWTALSAALLWPLCAPMPPGTYARLTLGLQLWVSASVVGALDLLGIAAHRQGNVIELARATVGIEEACSGVRSLVSCVFAGVLFSAALVRRPWARVLVVALSVPLALAMNFLRSLLLTLLVNAGVRVEGAWHDLTGYAVLGVTAGALAALAIVLDRGGRAHAGRPETGTGEAPNRGKGPAQAVLASVLAAALATLAFFAANTSASPGAAGAVPDLLSALPESAPGWQVVTRADLYRFAGVLRTEHLAERTYMRQGPAGSEQVTLYVAFWPAGQASAGLVGSHTPDACWPGAGWESRPVPDPSASLAVGAVGLPVAQHRLFQNGGYPQNVWFWQVYGGRVIDVGSTLSVPALVRVALRYGFRNGAPQAFIRVSSNRPWKDLSSEPLVAEFFARARALGLY